MNKIKKIFGSKALFFATALIIFINCANAEDNTQGITGDVLISPPAGATSSINSEDADLLEALEHGTAGEASDAIKKATKLDDVSATIIAAIERAALDSRSQDVKCAAVAFFIEKKSSNLKDLAFDVISNSADNTSNLVIKCIDYVRELEIVDASQPLRDLIELDSDDALSQKYFSAALTALGAVATTEDAQYISSLLDNEGLTSGQRQSLMKALSLMAGKGLLDDETKGRVIEIANDTEEDAFTRSWALEAAGALGEIDPISKAFETGDPNVREHCVNAARNALKGSLGDAATAHSIILSAIKDDHYKVRLAAIAAAEDLALGDAQEDLKVRAKRDKESIVKARAIKALGKIGGAEDFLISLLEDKKVSASIAYEAARSLIGMGLDSPVCDAASRAAGDRGRKAWAISLGKAIATKKNGPFGAACSAYLLSKDSDVVRAGLDLYRAGKWPECQSALDVVAKSRTSNARVAKKLLGQDESTPVSNAPSGKTPVDTKPVESEMTESGNPVEATKD